MWKNVTAVYNVNLMFLFHLDINFLYLSYFLQTFSILLFYLQVIVLYRTS